MFQSENLFFYGLSHYGNYSILNPKQDWFRGAEDLTELNLNIGSTPGWFVDYYSSSLAGFGRVHTLKFKLDLFAVTFHIKQLPEISIENVPLQTPDFTYSSSLGLPTQSASAQPPQLSFTFQENGFGNLISATISAFYTNENKAYVDNTFLHVSKISNSKFNLIVSNKSQTIAQEINLSNVEAIQTNNILLQNSQIICNDQNLVPFRKWVSPLIQTDNSKSRTIALGYGSYTLGKTIIIRRPSLSNLYFTPTLRISPYKYILQRILSS